MSDATACPANINAAGRRRRLVLGVVALAGSLAAHFALRPEQGSWQALAGVAVLVYGWLCVLQALANTCVVLAAVGKHETDGGTAPVGDAAIAAALKRRARTVWLQTAVAVVATVAALAALRRFGGV